MTGISPLDWLHDAARVEQIASCLRAAGIEEFEQSDASGRRIRLCVATDVCVDRAETALSEGRSARVIAAPYFGTLRLSDPHGSAFANRAGDRVGTGEVMALLTHGALVIPVRATTEGVVRVVLREEGDLVGHGDGLFALDEDVLSASAL